jgi:hypothetical protein
VSFWFKPLAQIPGDGHSSKFIRIWDDPDGNGTRVSWTQMHMTYDGGSEVNWGAWGGNGNSWNRLELYIDADKNLIQSWTNGKLRHNVREFVKSSNASGRGLNLARVGFDGGGENPPNIDFEFGEIYFDTTPARVEIGDAPIWSNVSHKEVQLPSSWSSNSVTFRVYQGSMNDLSGKYVYVVDSNGNVNSTGFPLCTNCAPITPKKPKPPEDLTAD